MPVPGYQKFMRPTLEALLDGKAHKLADLRGPVSESLGLGEADLAEMLPSGIQTTFVNRLSWSAVYLSRAGVIERIGRGVFRITPRGRELLNEHRDGITNRVLAQFPEFDAWRRPASPDSEEQPGAERDREARKPPNERIEEAFAELRESLVAEVLATVRQVSPAFFERLVVDLMVALGYGGSAQDAGQALGKSGDGGVDGMIKEDPLGLDRIYLQAKRWADTVGRPVVQAFAGSLEGHRARKGVLITTSQFSTEAREYVKLIEKRIVLIDGEELARLMVQHNVAVARAQTYEVKKLDLDYFEGE